MSRKLTVSTLFAVAFLAVAGFAQPPAKDVKLPEKKADVKKAPDPLDGLIGAALANDADVKMAQAKLQLADAELARARQQVVQKTVALHSAVREQKKLVITAEQLYSIASKAFEAKNGPFQDMLYAREKLEVSQGKLAQLETEMKLVTGGTRVSVDGWNDLTKAHHTAAFGATCTACHQVPVGEVRTFNEAVRVRLSREVWIPLTKTPIGAASDRLRAALDKPVKLGPKDQLVSFDQALEIFKKEAGLDLPVRYEFKLEVVVSLGEELPVGAWLQLFADGTHEARILVREYGLLITHKDRNPPDAMSVFDFWKQKPEKKSEPAK